MRNHRLGRPISDRKISLDNPWSDTYHTTVPAKKLTSHVREIHVGNRVNRGADSHDE
jgi:pyrrolidone-carboxylate peptidase